MGLAALQGVAEVREDEVGRELGLGLDGVGREADEDWITSAATLECGWVTSVGLDEVSPPLDVEMDEIREG